MNGNIAIYEPLPGVKNAVMTIIENIYDDEVYRASLLELEQTGEKGLKKVNMIKDAITELCIFGSSTQPLIMARDIGILMNLSNVQAMVKNFKEGNERVTGYIQDSRGNPKQVVFLTRNGIYRASMAGHSKLSEVFREFLYKLIDHMIVNENEKLRDLITKFQSENLEMIQSSVIELNNNYHALKELYAKERAERIEWQQMAEHEARARIGAEKDAQALNTELIRNSELMYLMEKKMTEDVSYISELIERENTNPSVELLLKKKFLKEVQVYLVDPVYLERLVAKSMPATKSKRDIRSSPLSDSDDDTYNARSPGLIITKEYLKNYRNVYDTYATYRILDEYEPLMYKLSFRKTTQIKNYIHVSTEYVTDKACFINALADMETEYMDMPSNARVYQTSLSYIRECISSRLESTMRDST